MLLRRRWVALTAALLVFIALSVRLGFWQLHRHEQRAANNALVEANYTREPAPVAALLRPGELPERGLTWRRVVASGRYDASRTVLLRNRTYQGRAGVHVLVPLVTADGAALLVNRGFVERAAGARAVTELPAPPQGEVSVVAHVRRPEGDGSTVVTRQGQVSVPRVDVPAIAATLPYPVFGAAADVASEQPPATVAPVPAERPGTSGGPHLSYALQWWIFALFGVGGWVLLLRRDLQEEREQQEGSAPSEAARGRPRQPQAVHQQGAQPQ